MTMMDGSGDVLTFEEYVFPRNLLQRTGKRVRVRVNDGPTTVFTLDNQIRPYTLRAAAPAAGRPLVVQLDAPTWCIAGEPAEQGVRVDRLSVRVP